MKLAPEYIASIVVVLSSILKAFGIEIENDILSGLIFGVVGLFLAIRAKKRENANILGAVKSY